MRQVGNIRLGGRHRPPLNKAEPRADVKMSIEAKTFINLVLVVLMGSVTTLPSTGGHADPSNRARISEEAFAPDANKAEPVSADWATTVEEAVRDILAN